ncbi:hypothetical protein D5278_02425 [bacterium 1XD21-13]|nr:hypothetical protein [bacterium 1XD21-13]
MTLPPILKAWFRLFIFIDILYFFIDKIYSKNDKKHKNIGYFFKMVPTYHAKNSPTKKPGNHCFCTIS